MPSSVLKRKRFSYFTYLCCIIIVMVFTSQAYAGSSTPSIAPLRPRPSEEQLPGRGFVPPPFDLSHLRAVMPQTQLPLQLRFDWRETGKVTPVKNQGSCGSCYAFASVGNFESKVLVDGGSSFDFSENNLKECEWYGSSCGGGNYWRVASFLSANGTVQESCDPYVPSNTVCNNTCSYLKTLLDWRVISYDEVPTAEALRAYLQSYGPIYTSMNAGHGGAWDSEFHSYDGSYTLYYEGLGDPNHAVLIVGWDDTLSHAGGYGAWIVKNSWGTSWGGPCGYGTEDGYFTIAYGSAKIGSYASFIYDWQDYDTNGALLYHDEGGYTGTVGYGSTTAWGMCKFVPAADVSIERVEFWTADATADIDVYLYDDFNGVSLSNLVTSELNTIFDNAGYHSVPLTTPAAVSSGDDIYAVVKITDKSYTFPIVFDAAGPRASGCCFISSTGASWSEWMSGDLGIRIRVTEEISCGQLQEWPSIVSIIDVPDDNGGFVELTWTKSIYDEQGSQPHVERYRIWRMRGQGAPSVLMAAPPDDRAPDGPYMIERVDDVWELVGTVESTGGCSYDYDAPTRCDSSGADTCWTYFLVAAYTDQSGQRFDSPPDRGYSVDNLGPGFDDQRDEEPDEYDREDRQGRVDLEIPEPNPGGNGFVIRFEIETPDWVELEVYDITGRRAATLVNGFVDSGPHTIKWDSGAGGTSPLAQGIYFVRLVTSLEVLTEKLVLVK
jgi:C1A family cysteine protease